MAEQSLKSKTVRGVGWSLADNIGNQGITFLVGLVLARLLSPDEYGLIGIIMVFITVFNGIVDSGFTNALIRKKDATDTDYNTVFYSNLLFSICLCIILFFSSYPIAEFFHRTELVALTQVMSLVILINGFTIIQNAILAKRIDFKTKTKASVVSSVLSGIFGVSAAFAGFGVWALVIQQISRQLINSLLLWILNRWRPRLVFSMDSFREMWSFGWKLLVSGLIDNIWKEVYQVVIGRCYSPVTLGQYTRAKQFTTMYSSQLSSVVQKVSYPVLSSIQDDKDRLRTGYRRIIRISMFVSCVLGFGMIASAKAMVLVLVGEQWLPCVPMLQIVSLNMILYPLHSLNLNMLQVSGRSDLFLKLEIAKKCIAVIPILCGIFGNIYLMLCVGFITGGCIDYILNSYYSGKFVKYTSIQQLKDILPCCCVALIMAVPVYLLSFLPFSHFIVFPLQLIVGAILTIVLSEIAKLPEYIELKGITMSLLRKKNNNK